VPRLCKLPGVRLEVRSQAYRTVPLRTDHSLARSKHSSRKPSPRTAWNVSSSRFVFRKLHTTTVPSISITPHIYPQLIQVVVNTPRKQRREGRSLSSNVIPMQHPACGLLRTPPLGSSLNKGKKRKGPGPDSTDPHGALEVAKLARFEPLQHQLEGLGANSGSPSERMVHGGYGEQHQGDHPR
jgi:hypothetical protein